uniref:bifunctional hydroxymethylpyrimidine kinase/phosphomethylpyrimidine kinase n=1 Tax=Anaerococcus mediterraneensis TaxID=1870984 RepID=UPI0009307CB2|nr:bifunctional hydroxymethylpyrimidine kinase/phosphomethylpyrimidine kinase [Anaerococcus mediterraneensis]
MKNILILNDYVSKGKIAARLMSPVLAYMDYEVFLLPTAMIANNFSLGKNAFFNTNTYIKDCLKTWRELDFKFDLIFIGYIDDQEQKNMIIDYIKSLDYETSIVFDPIMGDDGALYPGLDKSKIDNYKDMLEVADIVIPNQTEAKFLDLTQNPIKDKSLIITSCKDGHKNFVKIINDNPDQIPYEKIDIKVGGSGDLFDALFLGYYLQDKNIEKSVEKTIKSISKILKAQAKDRPEAIEINIEKYLNLIER